MVLSLTKLFQGFLSKPLNDYLQHAGIWAITFLIQVHFPNLGFQTSHI